MPGAWYYVSEQGTVGPLTLESLQGALEKMPDRATVLVWRQGFTDWQTAATVAELHATPELPPPPAWLSKSVPDEGPRSTFKLADVTGGKPVATDKKTGLLKKAAGLVVILLAAATAGVVGSRIGRDGYHEPTRPSQALNEATIHAGFKRARDDMKLPQKLDATTTLTDMTWDGRQITYLHDVNLPDAELNAASLDRQRGHVAKNVCKQELMTKLMPLGVSYRYAYKDAGGKSVGSFVIDEAECKRNSS